jgi:hypothetical protein
MVLVMSATFASRMSPHESQAALKSAKSEKQCEPKCYWIKSEIPKISKYSDPKNEFR